MKHRLAITALCVLVIDLALKHLPLGPERALIPGVIGISYARNTGVAFGMLSGYPALSLVLTALLIIAGSLVLRGLSLSRFESVCAGLIVGGALGNLVDRLIYGWVHDYLRFLFVDFPVFNAADIAVTTGAVLLMIALLFDIKKETA